MKSLMAAIAFLTRVPIGKIVTVDSSDVARSAGWFPLVGMLLGGVYSLAAAALKNHLPVGVVAILLVIIDAIATGALHFDGLADAADGFGGGKNREDVLRIMRDHAIGSYGGLALAAVVVLKVTTFAALLNQSDWITAVVLTPAFGRWGILLLTATLPYSRTSKSITEGMGKRSLVWGSVAISAALITAGSLRACIAMVSVVLTATLFRFYCRSRLGGITGDTLGANLQLCESAVLLTFLWSNLPH